MGWQSGQTISREALGRLKEKKDKPKIRTHQDIYDDIVKRNTLQKDQSLGRDSWEMRSPDTFYRSYLLCAACSNSAFYFSKTPLELTDVLADSP